MARADSAVEIAARNGRGVSVFRVTEAAAFLGVNRRTIDQACRDWVSSRGRRGLAHFFLGKGVMITRESLAKWMESLQNAMIA